MSKGSSASPAPAAQPVAPSKPAMESAYPAGDPITIEWDNDTQTGRSVESYRDPEQGSIVVDENATVTAKDDEPEPVVAKVDDDKPAKPSKAERRAEVLRALDSERKAQELAAALTAEKAQRAADKAALDKLQATIKDGNLGDLLQARNMTADEALELLVRGGDALTPTKTKASPTDEALEAIRAELAELKADRVKRDEDAAKAAAGANEQQAASAIAEVARIVKDMDIPVTHAVDNGYELVLRVAGQMWLNEGKTGNIGDYMADAAQEAEKHWRKEKPSLAALADRAGKRPPAEEAPPPSLGRRAAARPDARGQSYWKRDSSGNMPVREEIDEKIKREMGFRDKVS